MLGVIVFVLPNHHLKFISFFFVMNFCKTVIRDEISLQSFIIGHSVPVITIPVGRGSDRSLSLVFGDRFASSKITVALSHYASQYVDIFFATLPNF